MCIHVCNACVLDAWPQPDPHRTIDRLETFGFKYDCQNRECACFIDVTDALMFWHHYCVCWYCLVCVD